MNITDFIGKGFNVEQMREIRFGIAANLDIRYYEYEVDWEKSEFDIPSKNEFEKIFRLIFLDENKKHDKNTSMFVVITIDLTPVKHKYVVYENMIPDLKKLIKDIRKKQIKEK